MENDSSAPTIEFELTRQRLAQGVFLRALRDDPPLGVNVRSDAELDRTLNDVLGDHDPSQDVHLFGYGSLMWNPALDVIQTRVALVQGWHRRFCLRMIFGRGCPQKPGAMLALDRGGTCRGLLLRIDAAKVEAELRLLWRREMVAGSYDARWVWASAEGRKIRALTFVANRSHDRYIGGHPIDYVAGLIRTGEGRLGTSRAYFESTLQALGRLGIHDIGMARLRQAILRADLEAVSA